MQVPERGVSDLLSALHTLMLAKDLCYQVASIEIHFSENPKLIDK